MPSRSELMYDAIQRDYPNLPPDFINLVLDMHEKDPEWIESIIKEEKKKTKSNRAPPPKTQITVAELDELNEKWKKEQEIIFNNTKEAINVEVNEAIPESTEQC